MIVQLMRSNDPGATLVASTPHRLVIVAISACPNCCRRVIPDADGKCPNCQTTFTASNPVPERVLLGLKGGSKLPAVCHNCGLPTRRTKRIDVRFQPNDSALPPFL